MFHVDMTLEDFRIIAVESENPVDDEGKPLFPEAGTLMDVSFYETNMGMFVVKRRMTLVDLMRVLAVASTDDGETTVIATLAHANEILGSFGDWDHNQCRPVPTDNPPPFPEN